MSTTGLLAVEAGVIFVLVTALWAVSVAVRDTSIVDVFWGSGFVIVAWVAFALADGSRDRRLLLALLVTAWGLRLTVYLARRNLGKGEDRRYAAMRRRHGDRWPLRSLVVVFWLQGALMWIVSLPVPVAMTDPTPAGLVALDWIGGALWAVGLAFEAVGDAQLARFKAEPANRGKVMDRGLWRYTRHPNYFGDFCVWWGIWLIAVSHGQRVVDGGGSDRHVRPADPGQRRGAARAIADPAARGLRGLHRPHERVLPPAAAPPLTPGGASCPDRDGPLALPG